ncbi:Hypothetical predicted protein [Paramuricea clavata]|uniref:Uncharacterized protein n=1 Tax=Paramuricea clavata TaxID=317549 RepID=A0A7D9IS65_PARCT|nr:Hypothetical predicted protein [Paramuricea clavata]
MSNTKVLRQQLSSKEKELNSLENKNKIMQNQLTSKTKQHKDLQQEMKTLKNNSTTQTKRIKVLEKKNESLETEIEQKNSENDNLQEENENLKEEMAKTKKENAKEIKDLKQLQSVVDKGVAHSKSLEEEIKKLQDTTEKALKDKDEAQCSFDKDRAELCATLENYKAENEVIIAQKEKDLEKFKQNKEIEMEKQVKKIKELEQQLEDLNKSKLEGEKAKNKQIMDKDAEINILKEQLLEKEEETSENVEMQRVAETPSRAEHIVPCTPKTPRSILKQSAQPSKKRRVAFSYEKSKSYSSDEDDKAYKIFKPSEKKTVPRKGTSPAIPTKAVRPNVRHSPAPSQASALARKSNQSPFNRSTKKNSPEEATPDDELKQFNELFPAINYQPEKKSVAGKGKKASFRGKKTQISPRKKQPDVDWFDNDAFFGFDG